MVAINKMKLLISLAQIDGAVAPRERNYIINIGRANNVYPDQIEALFERSHTIVVPENLSADDKFSYLFSMVQLMKIDERMYKEELLFCRKMATSLGYEQQAMFELLLHVKAEEMPADQIAELKKLVQKFLK